MNYQYNYKQYVEEQIGTNNLEKIAALEKSGMKLNLSEITTDWLSDINDIEKRAEKEVKFILNQRIKNPIVLDTCLGTGSTSIGLKLYGIDQVVSNEINKEMINYSVTEAKKRNIKLKITEYDWRELGEHFSNEFDVVCCVGNSLTYLFKKEDQIKTLTNFRKALRKNGKLIIDERNYVEILKGNFRKTGKGPYKYDIVRLKPLYYDDYMLIMEYDNIKKNNKNHLILYPFKENEMKNLLLESGFSNIKKYGDYEEKYNPKEVEFYTYVAEKQT